jgi:hypothetical protein
MKKHTISTNNQNGSIVLVAMMLLVILTIMGITSTRTSIIENQTAVNEQLHKMAFYEADSGLYAAAKIVGALIDESDAISDQDFEFAYLIGEDEFYEQITGQAELKEGDGVFWYNLENGTVRVDVRHLGTSPFEGMGGAEFGVGASGHLGKGELLLFFRFFSEGTAPRNSVSTITAIYRKVVNHTDGL